MKENNKEKLLMKLRLYFKQHAFGHTLKKALTEIESHLGIMPTKDYRLIRELIAILRRQGIMIVADMNNRGKYFLVDINNEIDYNIAVAYDRSQKNRAIHIWLGRKCFNKLYPQGQMEMKFDSKPDEKTEQAMNEMQKEVKNYLNKLKKDYCEKE